MSSKYRVGFLEVMYYGALTSAERGYWFIYDHAIPRSLAGRYASEGEAIAEARRLSIARGNF
jgi:hypothetical protein